MPQLLIALTVVSFAIGMAAFVLCLLIYLSGRSAVTRYLLILQALIVYAAFYYFSVSSLRFGIYGSTAGIIAWHCAGHVWSGFFCYYYCLFLIRLTDTGLAELWRKLLIGACAALACSFAAPFLSAGSPGSLFDRITYQNSFIIYPLDLTAVIAGSFIELAALRRMPESAARRAVRNDLGVKAIMVPFAIAALFIEAESPGIADVWKFAVAHAYLLAWNALALVNAARVVRKASGASLAGTGVPREAPEPRARASASGRAFEAAAEAELDRLRRAMEKDKAFLEAGLTLPALAERLAMPRNRLSRLLNEAAGKSFNDFINEYRVGEAKGLLSSPDKGLDVLSVAFESGFNSKATFYAAFKKVAGMTPNEFRASISRPKG
jgi:AraC-like DNA-binding protein